MPQPATLKFSVNGKAVEISTDADRSLLEVLREDLELTGTKYGCGAGDCGACSVLVDGKRAFSCRESIADVEGKSVTTIEGLAGGETLHPVQQAFLDERGFQCGYCTPGMIVAAVALLSKNAKPSDDEIRDGMNRNLCRCCGYKNILAAVKRAAGGK